MGEAILYIVCIIALGVWMNHKVNKSKREYIDWIER